jgi:hypothetical protein
VTWVILGKLLAYQRARMQPITAGTRPITAKKFRTIRRAPTISAHVFLDVCSIPICAYRWYCGHSPSQPTLDHWLSMSNRFTVSQSVSQSFTAFRASLLLQLRSSVSCRPHQAFDPVVCLSKTNNSSTSRLVICWVEPIMRTGNFPVFMLCFNSLTSEWHTSSESLFDNRWIEYMC